jgi:Cyclin
MNTMMECCEDPQRHHQAIFEKYSDRRFKRASLYVEAEMKRGFKLSPTASLKDVDRLDGYANY